MSNLAPPKFELHPQDIDSHLGMSHTINDNNEYKTVTLSCSTESGSRHIEKEREVICTASIAQKESSTDDMTGTGGEPGSCYSEYPLKTSSPRVPRVTRSLKFPVEVQKPFASNGHDTSESSQTCNRDTMTAQLIAKNAVDLNHGNYSDIDTVKVGAPEQHNPHGSSEPSSHTNRAVIESTAHDAGHTCSKSERITGNGSRLVGTRHLSIANPPEYHTKLPFSISKFEDTAKTVRKRIPPGMVADMRQMFSVPIKRRQTMPVLSDIQKYKSSLREFVIPSASTEKVTTTLEMTLAGNSPEIDGGETETTERYFGVDSSLKEKCEKGKLKTNDCETKDKIKLSEVTVCVQNGSVMDKNDDDDNNSNSTEENVPQLQTSVMNVFVQNDSIENDKDDDSDDTSNDGISDVLEEYSDDSDVTCDEYDVCASKDDVMFGTRRPDDPPSTVNTPSYVDNILRLSRTDLNIDTELKEIKTEKSSDNKNYDSMDIEHDRAFNSVEMKAVDDSDISDDFVTSENKSGVIRHRKVNMYSVINEYKETDTQKRQSNLCTCINLHTHEGSHGDDNISNTQTRGVDVQCDDRNVLLTDKTADLHTKPEASTGEPVSKGESRLKTDKKNEQIQQKGGINCFRINVSPVAIGNRCTDVDSPINNTPTRSHVTFDKPRADDKVIEACPTLGERYKLEDDHVTLTTNTSPQVVSKQCSTPAGVVPGAFSSPQRSDCYGDFSQGIDNMPERSAGPNNNFSEISEYKGGKKVTTKTSTTDVNMNETSEEARQTLNILAEAMSKLNGDNNDDILPEIKQSVAKLDGGNLVITTLTRKIIEEEEESGRGTPLPDYNDVFYVRDHKGNVYMVEDLTEDSQESAYYSSSNVSQENDYNRIHNLRSIGQTNIDHSTAEEVLLGLYNQGRSTVKIEEIDENEKQLVLHKGNAAANLQNQYSTDSSFNKQSSKYEYDMCNGAPQGPAPWGPRSTSKVKTIKQSYEMTSDGRNCKDGQPSEEDIKMETEETSTIKNMDASGCKTMSSSFRYQTDASLLPQQPQEVQAMPPPPMILPPVQPKLVQLDMTPVLPKPEMPLMTTVPVTTTKVTESSTDRIVTSTENDDAKMKLSEHGRPVYKSVALVKGPYETPKWQVAKTKTEKVNEDVEDSKRYKLVKSHASNETQQREVSFQNSSTSMFHQISGAMNRAAVNESQNMYKSEQMIHMNGGPVVEPKIHRTRIDVSSPPVPRMDYPERDVCEYSESNRTYTTQKVQSEPVFHVRAPSPPRFQASSAEKDMMVVRGNILIKNTMDQGLDQFNDNINMFSKGFNMYKQNPLYQSDEDLQRRLAEEEERERRRQLDQDLTFETCDRYSKTKQGKFVIHHPLPVTDETLNTNDEAVSWVSGNVHRHDCEVCMPSDICSLSWYIYRCYTPAHDFAFFALAFTLRFSLQRHSKIDQTYYVGYEIMYLIRLHLRLPYDLNKNIVFVDQSPKISYLDRRHFSRFSYPVEYSHSLLVFLFYLKVWSIIYHKGMCVI